MPIVGGLIADRLLGQRRTVILGGVLMAIGHFDGFRGAVSVRARDAHLGIGACSADHLRSARSTLRATTAATAPSIFYLGINIGAFLAPLVCGTLAVQLAGTTASPPPA